MSSEYHNPQPPKINDLGEFQPFYGYTVISMIDFKNNYTVKDTCKTIENFIQTTSLKRFFSALPHETYHMTIYNVYVVNGLVAIPPVVNWIARNKVQTPMPNSWLPKEVLTKENTLALDVLKRYSNHGLKLNKARLYAHKKSLGVLVEMDDETFNCISAMRDKLSEIYGHADAVLGKRSDFHVTFGYGYSGEAVDDTNTDLAELKRLVEERFQQITLEKPDLFLFDSMVNYVPYVHHSTYLERDCIQE